MRARGILATVAAVGCAVAAAPLTAAAAAERAEVDVDRGYTVRGACAGGGRIAVAFAKQSDGWIRVDLKASALPLDVFWDVNVEVTDRADGDGGGGGGSSGMPTELNGSVHGSFMADAADVSDPFVRASVRAQDGSITCIARQQPTRQWALTSCALSGRRISATAARMGDVLALESRFRTVKAKSAWGVTASLASPHASEEVLGAAHASAAGVVHFASSSFGYAANRTLEISFTDKAGHGCSLSLATRKLPAPPG
jgi:hypothetical protein